MMPLIAPSDDTITSTEIADAAAGPAAASVASNAMCVDASTRSNGSTSRYAAFSAEVDDDDDRVPSISARGIVRSGSRVSSAA